MKVQNLGTFTFNLLLMLFVILVLLSGFFIHSPKMRIVPLIIGTPTFIFLIIAIIRDLSRESKIKDKFDIDLLRIMGWLLFFPAMIFVFGFFVATPIFLFVYLMKETELKKGKSLILTAAVTIAVNFTFYSGLKVELWPGILPEIVAKFLGGGILPPL